MDDPNTTLDALRRSADKAAVQRVVVVLRAETDGTTELLNSYDGVRVYDKGAVDPRVTMAGGPLPVFARWSDCESYLLENPGKRRPCLLSYDEAQRVFDQTPFADYTDYIRENTE
ncbi:MAG: hypothetical protein CMJ67_10665 [Planctomycetaceae bacterium]|nr:hypothetical protein [Planctomycetaceae bacterium]